MVAGKTAMKAAAKKAVTTAKGSSIIKGANGSNAKGKQSAKAKQSAKPKGAAKKDVVTPVLKKLTAKNLKAAQAEGLNELSLDQKLLKYQEDAAADVQLTGNDYTKLNLRFTQTALKKLPPQIQQAWQDASQGPGKQQRQHTILQAFGEDPTCGKHFLSKVQDFIESSKISVETQWISRKQLLAEFDESEAEELVEQGVLAVRKHPDNPSRLQYRRKKEFEVESREKSRKFIVATNMETDRQKAAWAVSQLRKGSLRRKSEAFEDESDDDDELGLAVPKKGEPKKKAEPKDPSKQKLKLDEAGLDSIADGDAETINDMAKKLSSYMHIALNSLKSQALLFQQTMYATPAKTKEGLIHEAVVDELDAAQKKLDGKYVKGQVTLKELKSGFACWQKAKGELCKVEKIVLMDDVSSTKGYSVAGKGKK